MVLILYPAAWLFVNACKSSVPITFHVQELSSSKTLFWRYCTSNRMLVQKLFTAAHLVARPSIQYPDMLQRFWSSQASRTCFSL